MTTCGGCHRVLTAAAFHGTSSTNGGTGVDQLTRLTKANGIPTVAITITTAITSVAIASSSSYSAAVRHPILPGTCRSTGFVPAAGMILLSAKALQRAIGPPTP